jgi:hypothetical protein
MSQIKSQITVGKVREALGVKADSVSDEKIEKFLSAIESGLEEYGNAVYSKTLGEVVENTDEKNKFLKMFSYYSDKFTDAMPTDSKANVDWMLYSEDFATFVKTGKLPSGKNVDSN